jgi:hypothetical protein
VQVRTGNGRLTESYPIKHPGTSTSFFSTMSIDAQWMCIVSNLLRTPNMLFKGFSQFFEKSSAMGEIRDE